MGGDAWGCEDSEGEGEAENCRSTAHITDTFAWFAGFCEQYQSQSDLEPLESETLAEIPIGASLSILEALMSVMAHAWKWILILALLVLPFGRKRLNYDNHRPSMLVYLRRCLGCASLCRGECMLSTEYSFDSMMDNVAWTLYVLKLGVWFYLFLATLYLAVVLIWSVVLWAVVIVTILVVMVVAACAVCAEGGGAACDCAGCDCGAFDTGGGDCCLCCPDPCVAAGGAGSSSDVFYWSGTWPHDPFWGYGAYGHVDVSSTDSCGCRLLQTARLLNIYPIMPENMWGGFVGYYILGTHSHCPVERIYPGGSQIIEFLAMGWRRTADLHDDSAWRTQVRDFLVGPEEPTPQRSYHRSQTVQTRFSEIDHEEVDRLMFPQASERRRVITINRTAARVICIDRPFNKDTDNCFESSYEDYKKNTCWICATGCDEWEMWISCKHLFCKRCSTEMLQRRMPCPLCRASSSTVLRGWHPEAENKFKHLKAPFTAYFSDDVKKDLKFTRVNATIPENIEFKTVLLNCSSRVLRWLLCGLSLIFIAFSCAGCDLDTSNLKITPPQ